MAGSYAATGHTSWAGGYDFTTDLQGLKLDLSVDAKDDTRFGYTGRARAATLEDVATQLKGFWEAGAGKVDTEVWSTRASSTARQPVSHSVSGAEGDVAYFYQGAKFNYSVGTEIGELLPFTLGIQGVRGNGSLSVGAVRGRVAKAKGSVAATGAIGTGQQLGAVAAGSYLYAALHVFAVGTTITVIVESDDNSGFTSPTTRATLGPVTTVSGVWATRVAGAITDDWFRFKVSAITGAATVAGVIGVK